MPRIEISLPEDLYAEFERLAEEEFVNDEEAVEELLVAGIDAYATGPEVSAEEIFTEEYNEEYGGDIWDTADGPRGEEDEPL